VVTFACETCGEPVAVAVKRNHRYCAKCKAERVRQSKNAWHRRKGELRATVRDELDWADAEVAQVLGLPVSYTGRCRGCGGPLPPMKRHGNPRKWCSEACRVRVSQRGVGVTSYVGALLADPCTYCGGEATELDHIVAATTGGDNDWSNLTPVCRRCNPQKRELDLLRYLLARPLFVEMDRLKVELAGLRAA
jgi:5-methylcytosine-specific restriction endonuclease McrA